MIRVKEKYAVHAMKKTWKILSLSYYWFLKTFEVSKQAHGSLTVREI